MTTIKKLNEGICNKNDLQGEQTKWLPLYLQLIVTFTSHRSFWKVNDTVSCVITSTEMNHDFYKEDKEIMEKIGMKGVQ